MAKQHSLTEYLIPGSLLTGLGIGLSIGSPGVGCLVGLGGGFLLTSICNIFLDGQSKLLGIEELEQRISKLEENAKKNG
ncbi:hypothetical protein F7984_09765 [Pradoshia sp. D12]|uniref:hypothetical protein n=1 Tax=Bacillaceae TaxID=186817 RepID=UPI00080AC537|nr:MULTISPECIES: hypothetical protein [Bacillaceae]OCA86723.1 hypothetical protein A8L44_05410 [Bacillus sp. FJAT-27986]QFK71501.1 hypothetical protein F7984_09765 [Pradoshia sp. D12]TPF73296.1 hypothetical protein FHY44_06160 [Bacillus sp. D12]